MKPLSDMPSRAAAKHAPKLQRLHRRLAKVAPQQRAAVMRSIQVERQASTRRKPSR